jgi:large subunit ribosomal protein L24e
MVIKYQTCSFSEYKIAPGHGIRYAEVNGKTHWFINKKVLKLFRHGKKPLSIRWTPKWRIGHKKNKTEETKSKVQKQRKERQVKAIVGLSLEEINRIRESMKEERANDAARYKYAQEIKEKRKKYLDKVRKLKGDRPQATTQKSVKQNIPSKGAQTKGRK